MVSKSVLTNHLFVHPQGSVHEFHDDSAYFEDHTVTGGQKFLRLGQTVSRLYLDCLTHKDEAEYTCVAETPFNRKTQKTMLKVGE